MLKIGDFSKLAKVTIKTLRYYDDIGLLKPEYVSRDNNYRYYKPEQLNRISKIVALKDMGFLLDEIANYFQSTDNYLVLRQLLKTKRKHIQQRIDQEKDILKKIDNYLILMKEGTMSKVEIKTLPEVIVASCRKIIPSYDALFKEAPAMGEKMKQHGAVCREPAYCFNIYYDNEYKDKDIDLEICEAVEKQLPDKDGIIYKIIARVDQAACIYHKGPYETLGKSYGEIYEWLEKLGYEAIDNCRESYIDGIWNTKDPNNWLTEIQIPVRKK